jgi:hypothetical protein
MELRFPQSDIRNWAVRYEKELGEKDRGLTDAITRDVFPSYERNGFLTKKEFLTVCAWKTLRSRRWCESNDESLIRDVSAFARTTESERLRIQVWTLLAGVKWPTASVFLHFAFPERYPILDFRALWSLKTKVPPQYTFAFWSEYAMFCRALAQSSGVTIRVLDEALWKYSDMNQRS